MWRILCRICHCQSFHSLSVTAGKNARRKAFAFKFEAGRDLYAGKTETLLLKRGVNSGRGTTFSKHAAGLGGSSSFSPANSPADPGTVELAGLRKLAASVFIGIQNLLSFFSDGLMSTTKLVEAGRFWSYTEIVRGLCLLLLIVWVIVNFRSSILIGYFMLQGSKITCIWCIDGNRNTKYRACQ
jgi:hypothetical protein